MNVSATLVRNVLAPARVPPAPERGQLSWRSFLRQHSSTIVACDFFTVDTVWLRRLYVLFFISMGTRRVEYFACTSNPDGAWMAQQARNLLMDLDDRSQRHADPGTERERTRERWVGSVRRECLDRLLIVGRCHLEHVLSVYVGHFNRQRPHRALDLQPPDRGSGTDPPPTATLYTPQVRRRDLLGGLLHEYEAAA